VRPHEFLPQTRQAKRLDWDRLQLAAQLFLMGLFKKAVLADAAAPIAERVFRQPGRHASSAVWLAVLCYAVQIYCDFSGYSDMAVGVAHAFGFKLPANFNMPYFAASIGEFWRRWHITLSTWLRDYLYIPLGGNRRGLGRTCLNLMLTMLLGGLWHGAKWTFVFWGGYHGLLLVLQRLRPLPPVLASAALRPVRVAATFLLVCVGWVFFRAASFPDAWTMLARLLRPTDGATLSSAQQRLALTLLGTVLLGHAAGTFLPLQRLERRAPALALGLAYGLAFLAIQVLIPEAGGAFIYFQF
jgi:alginate O-acetyltransferase complex protein AlgI